MYRKIMWCYIIILTLLDISLNSKLTAQGKSHGTDYSVPDTLAEGVNFQEWGKEGGGGAEGGVSALRLSPAALAFGARPLGEAHAATVTLLNTANVTLHLASVAGTTPDFHASFFDTKTLAPHGNTTFNVVYLGRREGPVSALLFIHTSRGVHKYPVSALGVASEWEVWPLLGVRVPANATLEPLLTLRNPTASPVQVTEVYSSGGWVKLILEEESASAGAWLLPPRGARPLLRLRLQPPPHAHTATAYVRIKTNASDSGLIVALEARAAPAGEFASPLQLRLRARGHLDPPDSWQISVGSSAGAGARLEAGVTGARCEPAPRPAPSPTPTPSASASAAHPAAAEPPPPAHHNGVKSSGASVSVLRPNVEPYQELTASAQLTLDYEKLWAEFSSDPSIEYKHKQQPDGAYCSGTLNLGRAAVPYSLRLLPGTLALTPSALDLITSDLEGSTKETELVAENAFSIPIRLVHLEYPDKVHNFVQISGFTGQVIQPKAKAVVARLQLKEDVGMLATLDAKLLLHTNISMYTVPLRVYSGKVELEWEWPGAEQGEGGSHLSVGALGVSSTRRIGCRVRNPAPAPLCVRALRTDLPGAQLALPACAHAHAPAPPDHVCRCIPAGGWTALVLTVVAPARAGALRGAVTVVTSHAATEATVSLTAHKGRLAALPVHLEDCAPYAWAVAPVIIDNSMALRMRVLGWSDGAGGAGGAGEGGPDLALTYRAPPAADVPPGRSEVGHITYMPEKLCEPHCYTGLDPFTEEGMAWVANGEAWNASPAEGAGVGIEGALRADRALLDARRALYHTRSTNISLHVRTTQVAVVGVRGWVRLGWPRLAAGGAGGAADAGLAAVGHATTLRVRARNPSRSHHILLQPVLGPHTHPAPDVWEGAEGAACPAGCTYALDAFRLTGWRTVSGDAREWPHAHGRFSSNSSVSLPMLALGPAAEIEININFVPREPSALTAHLYLRNNLTILEGVQLAGRGAFPSFEIGGRRPGASTPLVFEVTECGQAGVVKRVLAARNTGAVAVRLRDWRVAGAPCAARGFALAPCAALALQPNKSSPLTLTFTPDFTLARVQATLELRTDRARLSFQLAAVTAPRLLAKCTAQAPKPPFDPGLRAGGTLLALALLALVLAAAALDAERLLRKARAARAASQPRAPLDLRAVAAAPAPAPAPPPAPPRVPPPRRRKVRKMDPAAESRAFERWRASLQRPDDTDSRSSEDLEPELTPTDPSPSEHIHTPAPAPPPPPPPPYEPLLESECNPPQSSGEDEPQSSESESSSPLEPDDDDRGMKADKPRVRRDAAPHADIGRRAAGAGAGVGAVEHAPVEAHTRARRREAETRRTERRAEAEGVRAAGVVRAAGAGAAVGAGAGAAGAGARPHGRKDKPRTRRDRDRDRDRAAPTPPRTDPPHAGAETRVGSGNSCGSGAGAVRWGASWSSVVARSSATPPAPPTPTPTVAVAPAPAHAPPPADAHMHAHVHARPEPTHALHRPAPAPVPVSAESNSLFYFNGAPSAVAAAPLRPEAEYAWRAPPPPPPGERAFASPPPPHRDYLEEAGDRGTSYGSIGAGLWGGSGCGAGAAAGGGAGAAGAGGAERWPWAAAGAPAYCPAPGAGPVRPPPGFGSTPTTTVGSLAPGAPGPVGSRTVRPFDPFQSLAAIWSRTALDWRDTDDHPRDN